MVKKQNKRCWLVVSNNNQSAVSNNNQSAITFHLIGLKTKCRVLIGCFKQQSYFPSIAYLRTLVGPWERMSQCIPYFGALSMQNVIQRAPFRILHNQTDIRPSGTRSIQLNNVFMFHPRQLTHLHSESLPCILRCYVFDGNVHPPPFSPTHNAEAALANNLPKTNHFTTQQLNPQKIHDSNRKILTLFIGFDSSSLTSRFFISV